VWYITLKQDTVGNAQIFREFFQRVFFRAGAIYYKLNILREEHQRPDDLIESVFLNQPGGSDKGSLFLLIEMQDECRE